MNAPKMHELSAPTDDFLADLERFGVPFGVEINGRWISTPPSAWRRVFDGPHGDDGRPLNAGGIPPQIAKVMRAEAFSRPGHRHSKTARLPKRPPVAVSSWELYSAAVTAPPAREPAAEGDQPRTGAASAHEKGIKC